MNVFTLKKTPALVKGWGLLRDRKNPGLYPYPSYPYPLLLRVCKPLHIATKDNQVGSGNGVPGQEDEESGGTKKEDWVLTIIICTYGKEGKAERIIT